MNLLNLTDRREHLAWLRLNDHDVLAERCLNMEALLQAVRQQRVIWAELKAARGVVTTDQQAWLDDLRAAGCEAHVWRPEQWHSGEIDRILKGEQP